MKRFYETTFTVPAHTPASALFAQPVPLEDNKLETVRIVIPDGHAGLTGLQILWGGVQVVPFGQGTFIVADGEIIDYAWDGEITAAGLSLAGYNTDAFPHSFYLRWVITDLVTTTPAIIESPQAAATVTPEVAAIVGGLTGVGASQ